VNREHWRLWGADLNSGQRQRLLPDFRMLHYSISGDGQRVVFVAEGENGRRPIWLATLDGRTAPRQLTTIDGWVAYFGAPGEVVFRSEEKPASFLYRIKEDGSGLQKITQMPMLLPFSVSPDGQWVSAAEGPSPETRNALMVHPGGGGSPRLICRCYPAPNIENGPMPSQMSWTRRLLSVNNASFTGERPACHLEASTPGALHPFITCLKPITQSLFLQRRGPVEHDCDRGHISSLRRNVYQEAPAISGNGVTAVSAFAKHRLEQRLGSVIFKCGISPERDRHQLSVRGDEVEFLAIAPPHGAEAAARRNLPLAARRGKRLDPPRLPRLRRVVRHPANIRREATLAFAVLGLHNRIWRADSDTTQRSQLVLPSMC
jgi:hypothetical protein